jgi:NAD(P)-dependent dehydrogenase (short-subunit alcohol dehydrogenase family)
MLAVTMESMSEQTITLVTGANKGIGYAIAAGLGALGWSVGVGARVERRRRRSGGASASAPGMSGAGRTPWRSCVRPVPTHSAYRWT